MDQLDRKQFAAEMFRLAEAFGTKVSEARAEAYFEGLQDYDVLDIRVACRKAIAERVHFPKVAELREMCAQVVLEQRRAAYKEPEVHEPLRCGPDVPCEACQVVGCQCQGCLDAIAKCRAEFKEIVAHAAAGRLTLMRVPPPPPDREVTAEDRAAHQRRVREEIARLQSRALPQADDEVPF